MAIQQRRKRQRAMALEREARMDAGIGDDAGDDPTAGPSAGKGPKYTARGRPRREHFD